MDLDLGYNGDKSGTTTNPNDVNGGESSATDLDTGGIQHNPTGEPVDDVTGLNNGGTNADGSSNADGTNSDKPADKDGEKDGGESSIELTVGASVEVGDDTYTVDKDGNLVDKDGKLFKEAKDVKDWLASFDKVEETGDGDSISIDSIREAIGIEITNDDDTPIEFENTPAGIKAYIDAVIETSKDEHFEAAINTLYQRYPILNDVLNYYVANGNSLDGFGEIPDRSGITIDDTNEAQHEAIIRTAWEEQGRKGDVEGYIQYLKSSGTLCATAKEELAGLQEADAQYRDELERQAEEQENLRIQKLQEYWTGVHEVIESRNIAGYQIPDTIIINRNGQKISATPKDFFDYVYQVDANGKSAYEKSLASKPMEARRDDELLRAYLDFVGGDYSNLVDMAINKEKVNKLRLKAKEKTTASVRINKPKPTASKGADIDLGYK